MIESTSLRYFREVTRLGSIKRAADSLKIAPSAISRQIQGLEAELSVKLFKRGVRGMSLTEAGELLHVFALDSHKRIDDIRSGVHEFGSLHRGHVRIASVEGLLASFLSGFVVDMAKNYPGITMTVTTVGSRNVADMVASGEAEFGLLFGPAPRRDLVELAHMGQGLCVVVAPSHPLAGKSICTIEELAELNVILPDPSFGIRQEIDRVCHQAKIRLNQRYETNSLAFARTVVAESGLATFQPRDSVMRSLIAGTLVAIPLDHKRLEATRVTLIQTSSQQTTLTGQRIAEMLIKRMQQNDRDALSALEQPRQRAIARTSC